jgi:WG containing repeat
VPVVCSYSNRYSPRTNVRFVGAFSCLRERDVWLHQSASINELGEMIIPTQFDWAGSFSEGLAFVKLKLHGEAYFIDTNGKIVFSTDADVMTPFKNGLAQLMSCITKPCQAVYVDKQGRTVWQGPSE